ncbi:(2Fe-2S)-binding protein [Streptosporangium sp. V21-05]|uniref:(2Fe-2S)-binding protein n=1 Tax=Streptosporangium sp. V21-05 TaxID=3446115 RepID=UPI003F52BA6A
MTLPEVFPGSPREDVVAVPSVRSGAPGPFPASPAAIAAAVADVSAAGGYFGLELGPLLPEPGWRPLTDLLTDPGTVEARVADMAGRLGTAQTRVAASILFQGLAARFWSPSLGAAVAHDLLVDLAPRHVYWRPAAGGPLPLRAVHLEGQEVRDPASITGPLYRTVVTGLLEPLAETVRRVVPTAPGLLWGNAASALVGTLLELGRHRPGLAAKAVALGRELLDTGLLRGTGELAEPVPGRPLFARRSCCLFYRLPGGGMCGDCVLVDPEIRRERWARAARESGR